jgi:hypothetical protein
VGEGTQAGDPSHSPHPSGNYWAGTSEFSEIAHEIKKVGGGISKCADRF